MNAAQEQEILEKLTELRNRLLEMCENAEKAMKPFADKVSKIDGITIVSVGTAPTADDYAKVKEAHDKMMLTVALLKANV